jgi:RimJ/RimL family protein N-acetyltransferase
MQSERVLIRPWEGRDDVGERLWPPYTDPFSPFWNIPRSRTLLDNLFSLSFYPHRYVWAIEDHTSSLIGRISLRDIKYYLQQARLGISLSQAYTSKGFGTEALTLFLEHFFGPLGFGVMLLDVAAFNYRAVRCYERLGFQHVGTEWRRARPDPCLQLLDQPDYHHMLPFFQYQRSGIWVQFLEMALHKHHWEQRP